MAEITIYHNPKCSKSRGALTILQERGVDLEVVEYLQTPLTRAFLEQVLGLLQDDPSELVRKDKRFKELDLAATDFQTPEAVVQILLSHPELMQRPIVVRGNRAVIARPSELALDVLD